MGGCVFNLMVSITLIFEIFGSAVTVLHTMWILLMGVCCITAFCSVASIELFMIYEGKFLVAKEGEKVFFPSLLLH